MQQLELRVPWGAHLSPEPKRMLLRQSEVIRTSLVHEDEPARRGRVPRVRRNRIHRGLQPRLKQIGCALGFRGRSRRSSEAVVPLGGPEPLEGVVWIFGRQSQPRIAFRNHKHPPKVHAKSIVSPFVRANSKPLRRILTKAR